MLTPYAKNLFLESLRTLRGGSVELVCDGRTLTFGDPRSPLRAVILVHDARFFRRALFGGDIGLGEAWMDGDWSSPDLVTLVRLAARNLAALERSNSFWSRLSRGLDSLRHRRHHYHLSNSFYQLFLDPTMIYSCACFESEYDSLERAQTNKLDLICRKLQLTPDDHVLEIGTGWGGFADYAVRQYGCRVTTTTISAQQFEYSRRRFASLPHGDRITLLQEDYRRLTGQYDKIVSIETFEAVGLRYYDHFFRACDRLLRPDGAMLLQTVTINQQTFPSYRRRADWIRKYIFPGSEPASVSEILRSLARATSLSLHHAQDIGTHYARTLAAWRRNFRQASAEIQALGFDQRFLRMWDYYLAYCEGAFLERHIGNFQLLLTKTHSPRTLFGEPWCQTEKEYDSVSHFAQRAIDPAPAR